MALFPLRCCCYNIENGAAAGFLMGMMSFVATALLMMGEAIFDSLRTNKVIELAHNDKMETPGVAFVLIIMLGVKVLADVFFLYGVVKEEIMIKPYINVWFMIWPIASFFYFYQITAFHVFTLAAGLNFLGLSMYAALLAYSFYKEFGNKK